MTWSFGQLAGKASPDKTGAPPSVPSPLVHTGLPVFLPFPHAYTRHHASAHRSWLPYAAIDAQAACIALQARGYSVTLLTGVRATEDRVCSALRDLVGNYRNLGFWYAGHSCNNGRNLLFYDTDGFTQKEKDETTADVIVQQIKEGVQGEPQV